VTSSHHECSPRLAQIGEEKDRAAAELESLLAVIRELRFRLQESDEGNKGLEKENMKLCWQQVEWKSELQAPSYAPGLLFARACGDSFPSG
jgi:hypothetical protein